MVGGLVDCPVIAVPTSIGYGAHFQGVAALLGMLNSCASNVVVVNIDAGFSGGHVASLIARRMGQARSTAAAAVIGWPHVGGIARPWRVRACDEFDALIGASVHGPGTDRSDPGAAASPGR